ncbi:phosphate ABC transporter permease subunit PstC [Fischerella thermalis]|jgi:phosphate transport system permease protein|uniref:Phosphate transport system permease protein n=1 Tax=Fischerella thermalis JSC-11 TaxID=741277 RepID=G6FNN3_9CYAN|nr:phosphate ABC transporter permease subunit PstC [Fischerella thermalis]PMB04194.1 phosphate ABC transporter permease subunit PstC [Fischerella thermalis CCMEE 5328]EHC19663.1 phosphate ABC transporter, inner membrane subunit PstC [Fischerella thermalis JSC-11]PLZ05169.1 phosphate ABC transporter permease subunit PstC [Fischerella thermalis WC1110]PLZ10029.1 phosphate ABC transporter permease subunit PstC [Fischerella thermalis WC114]PLZ15221.1 phosphate ABC transporter permease subunit PstC
MSINPLSTPKDSSLWQPNRSLNKLVEAGVKAIFATFAFISVATTIGIVLTLVFETVSFFEKVPIGRFLTETQWTPLFANQQFGIMVLLSATLLTSAIAIAVALPVGLLIAVCLSEYAPAGLRKWLKPALEILAGVPTVVFGYFALLTVTPFLQTFIPGLQGFNALSAGIVLGISIIPLVASLSEDAIYAVPQSLRNGSYALGATKRETIVSVVLPAALSGIVASFILSISRAIGETMIVTIAAGQNPRLGFNPLVPVQTMTAYIVQVSQGDTPAGSLAYNTIFAVGMTLFLITLALNIFSYWFVRRFREKYE